MNHPEFTAKVHAMLRDGFGAEDIAVKMNMPAQTIRNEVEILRGEGRLECLYGTARYGPTALRLMGQRR